MYASVRFRRSKANVLKYDGDKTKLKSFIENSNLALSESAGSIKITNVHAPKTINVGDWIVFCWGYVNVYSEEEFHRTFKIVGD